MRARNRTRFAGLLAAVAVGLGMVAAGASPALATPADGPHVVATIPFYWAWPATTNVATHTTYVGDIHSSRLMIIDDRTGARTIRGLDGCMCLGGMVSDDHAGQLFIAPGGEENDLYMFDEKTFRLRLISQDGMWSLAVDQSTDTVYAGDAFNRVIHVIDGRTGRFTGAIHVGYAAGLTVDPVRHLLYATDQSTGDARPAPGYGNPFDVTVIDLRTHRIVGHVPQAAWVMDIDVRRDRLFTVTPDSRIAMIDGRSHQVLKYLPLPSGLYPGSLAFDPVDGRLYATAATTCYSCTDYLVVLDPDRSAVLKTLPVGVLAAGMSLDPVLDRAYVATEYHVRVIAG